jgi:hypothetical protein
MLITAPTTSWTPAPADDLGEAAARGREPLGGGRVLPLEGARGAGAEGDVEEDGDRHQQVRADDEHDDQQRLAVARAVERDAAADEDRGDDQRRDRRKHREDEQRAVTAHNRPAFLRELPAALNPVHGGILLHRAPAYSCGGCAVMPV